MGSQRWVISGDFGRKLIEIMTGDSFEIDL